VALGQTADLGFSFSTVDSCQAEGRHIVDYCIQEAISNGLREGDIIVGINHKPLPNANDNYKPGSTRKRLSHDELVEQIVTTPRPFILDVSRAQQIVAPDQTALQRQHQRWFVSFCKHYRIETAAVKASLRLRRCTKFDNLSTRCHLILCLRVMIKFVDDWLGVTKLSELAGVHLADSAWFKLEFAICQQVNWNLVFFCHSSSGTLTSEKDAPVANGATTSEKCEFWDALDQTSGPMISNIFEKSESDSESTQSNSTTETEAELLNRSVDPQDSNDFQTAIDDTPDRPSKSHKAQDQQSAATSTSGPYAATGFKDSGYKHPIHGTKPSTATKKKGIFGSAIGLFGCMSGTFNPLSSARSVPKSALP
jgi:hypothetical protein